MLVRHLYDYRNKKKTPWGCIVAVGRGQIGCSFCGPCDDYNKTTGRNIAASRAYVGGQVVTVPKGKITTKSGYKAGKAHTFNIELYDMHIRSNMYFK